jgi:hypothetical protein
MKKKDNYDLNFFKKLPRNIRYGLISLEVEELIKKISEKYNLKTPEKIENISVLVGNFVAGQLNEESLKKEIYQRFQLNNTTSLDFLADFKKIIEEVKRIGLEKVKEDLVVLRFNALIEKIPEVLEKEIGIYDIFFPNEKIPQKPTIENWIKDYKLRKDDKRETNVLNIGDYLYNNKNTQELDSEEKEKLMILLNCYEKNKLTYYNKLFKEIDFEIIQLLNKNKPKDFNINITKFESKPYHDSDQNKEKENKINTPITQNKDGKKVLDLNNYL